MGECHRVGSLYREVTGSGNTIGFSLNLIEQVINFAAEVETIQ